MIKLNLIEGPRRARVRLKNINVKVRRKAAPRKNKNSDFMSR